MLSSANTPGTCRSTARPRCWQARASGYFWAIARDDRPWGGPEPPGIVYTYMPGRSAALGLKPYSGIVQCDGYAVYKQMADPRRDGGAATLAFCWAHLRRRFYDIAKGGAAPLAEEALARIAALYAIEAKIRGQSAAARRAARQTEAAPLVAEVKTGSRRNSPASPPNRSSRASVNR